jgi:hypothetical protein
MLNGDLEAMAFARRDRSRVSIRSAIQSKDRPVDERHFDQSLMALTSSGSRRGTFQSLAAVGAALIAGISGSATAQKSRNDGGVRGERKKKAERGPAGPAGPAGATGAAGPAGTPGEPSNLVTRTAAESGVLSATAGSEVSSTVECGLASVPINCSWFYLGAASDFDRTTTAVGPEFFRGVGSCRALLRRTATVANAGGQIVATALCTS